MLPIINSRWPLPIGNKQSITKIPVCKGWLTLPLVIIPGPFFSFKDLKEPKLDSKPSKGVPKLSTILPRISGPTGIFNLFLDDYLPFLKEYLLNSFFY